MKKKETLMALAFSTFVLTQASYAADVTNTGTVENTGNVTVLDGNLSVQPAPGAGPVPTTVGNPGGAPTAIDNGDGTTTLVTLANTVTLTQTTTTDGGVVLQPDGSATFDAQEVVKEQTEYYVYNVETIDNNTLAVVGSANDG